MNTSNATRREMLQLAGQGMAAAAFSAATGNVLAQEPAARQPAAQSTSGKIPFSLIIDDGSPVDPLFYELPGYETPFLVPAEFTRRVADTFDRFDLPSVTQSVAERLVVCANDAVPPMPDSTVAATPVFRKSRLD